MLWISNTIMWIHFAFLFLAGTALANPMIWKEGYQYHYLVRNRAFAGMSKLSPQFSGVVIKGLLQIRVVKPDTLVVQLSEAKYARVHTKLQGGWDGPVPDQELKYIDLPEGNPYKILLDPGNVYQVYANPKEPVWQVNMMKGILSQLQFNTVIEPLNEFQSPLKNNYVYDTYKLLEQTVSGNCNTIYDIMPIHIDNLRNTYVVPISQLKRDQYLSVIKNRDYNDCTELPMYHFAMTKEQKKNIHKFYFTRLASTDMIISLNEEHFTIRSSIAKNTIQVRFKLDDMQNSDVSTMINLTLVEIKNARGRSAIPTKVESAGNLTYIFTNDFNTRTKPMSFDLELTSKFSGSSEFNSREINTTFQNSQPHERNLRSERSRNNVESRGREFDPIHKSALHDNLSSVMIDYADISSQIDSPTLIHKAYRLIHDIAMDTVMPYLISEIPTLERFTILINILRHLKEDDIVAVETKIHFNTLLSEDVWIIFRDALTQAGTGPAFLHIHKWILSGKVRYMEAADLISRIPRTLREPTVEYIQKFYEIITDPEVKKQPFLNTTAPYAFTELVRYVMHGKLQYFYPIRTYGNLIKEETQKRLIDTYIPYFTKELKQAYDAKENNKIVTYTIALGNLAHKQIIPVFEPYLEGKYTLTTFQRTLMVGALKRLSDIKPELIRPIVYKIYLNDMESYEVRVAAVQVLLNSRPPLHMLQRIAKKTNYETDPQVNNAIITGIINLAGLREEKYGEVAKNARLVMKLLNPNFKPTNKLSFSIIQDFVSEDNDFTAWFNWNTLANKNSMYPNIFNVRVGSVFSKFSPHDFNTMYAIADVSLIERIVKLLLSGDRNIPKQSVVDRLASQLNIFLDSRKAIEGCFILNNLYGVYLITFDQHTLQNILHAALKIQTDRYDALMNVNKTSLVNWEATTIYPSEIGLLVSNRLKAPLLTALKSQIQLKRQTESMDLNVKVDILISHKITNRLGFTIPFDNQYYVCGVDITTQAHIPVAFNYHENMRRKIDLEFELIPDSTPMKLWHHSVVPFTSIVDVVNFDPVDYNNTQNINMGTFQRKENEFGKVIIIRVVDTVWPNTIYSNYNNLQTHSNYFQKIMSYISSMNIYYKKTQVISKYEPNEEIKLKISFNYSDIFSLGSALDKRVKLDKLLKEMRFKLDDKGSEPTSVRTVHVQFKVPGENVHYYCNGGILNYKTVQISELYGNCHLQSSDSVFKICGVAEAYYTHSGCPAIDISFENTNRWNALLRYGKSCDDGKEIRIQGDQKQSGQVKVAIMNSEEYQRCKEEGNLSLTNCRKVCKHIDVKDELSFRIETDAKELNALYHYAVVTLDNFIIPDINVKLMTPLNKCLVNVSDKIDLKIKKLLHSEILNLTLSSPQLTYQTLLDIFTLPEPIKEKIDLSLGVKETTSCMLDKTKILTFDGLEYSINMTECQYVLMISPTSVKFDPNLDIISKLEAMPDDRNVAVLVKNLRNGQRQLTIILSIETYTLQLSNSDNEQLILNERPVEFKKNRVLLFEGSNKSIEIIQLPHNMYKISIKSFGVYIYFDGQRVQLKAADKYNKFVRGLCGNKDNIKENDLMAPQGCVWKNPEHMIAYTFVGDKCPAVVLQNQKEVECVKQEHQQTDVVSDLKMRSINPYRI